MFWQTNYPHNKSVYSHHRWINKRSTKKWILKFILHAEQLCSLHYRSTPFSESILIYRGLKHAICWKHVPTVAQWQQLNWDLRKTLHNAGQRGAGHVQKVDNHSVHAWGWPFGRWHRFHSTLALLTLLIIFEINLSPIISTTPVDH